MYAGAVATAGIGIGWSGVAYMAAGVLGGGAIGGAVSYARGGEFSEGAETGAAIGSVVGGFPGIFRSAGSLARRAGQNILQNPAVGRVSSAVGRQVDSLVEGLQSFDISVPGLVSTMGSGRRVINVRRTIGTWDHPVEVAGRRVYQRGDLFDPLATDARGILTNLQRMERGRPPTGYDGEPVSLHHLIQIEPGPIAEVGGAFHSRHTKVLHGLVENRSSFRYTTDGKLSEAEKAFNRWSYRYWQERAKGFKNDNRIGY